MAGVMELRRGGRASRKRQKRAQQQRSDRSRGIAAARASGFRKRSPQPQLSGRDAAARRASQGTTQRDLQQSVGSLDRRVQDALKQGNTVLAKDLRSRQNKFARELGYKRAHEAMINAAPLDKREQVRRQLKGSPNFLNTRGFNILQQTREQDFLDPTRKLYNEFPDQYKKMYPFAGAVQGGLPTVRLVKKALGIEDKPIPYSQPDMPGVRYPLERTTDAPNVAQSLRNLPESANELRGNMEAAIKEAEMRQLRGQRFDREGEVKALENRAQGIAGVLDNRGIDTTRNIPDMEDALKAQDLAGRAVPPISQRQPGVGATPMTLSDVANMERMNAIRNQIALNTGILANLPEGLDPTRIGSVQGSGQGLMSVFDMQDFVNRNPTTIYPQGYPTQSTMGDTGLDFYGGNVAFGNTPEARAALEALRSINPNQSFTNMLGGVGIGGLR